MQGGEVRLVREAFICTTALLSIWWVGLQPEAVWWMWVLVVVAGGSWGYYFQSLVKTVKTMVREWRARRADR